MTAKIWVIRHSLKYSDNHISILHITRERYSALIEQRKKDRYSDYYLERVTARKAVKMRRDYLKESYRKEYDAAIAKKYNVSDNWKNNRWFVEQVRPSLYN